jgi:hypothetical protein
MYGDSYTKHTNTQRWETHVSLPLQQVMITYECGLKSSRPNTEQTNL